MKLHTLTLVTLTALATLAALPGSAATDPAADTTATQDGRGRPRGGLMMPGGPRGPGGPGARIENLDTNNDDKVSKEEFLAGRLDNLDDMFSRRDDNGDGLIAADEGRPQRADRGERGSRRGDRGDRGERGGRMQRADIDRDAVLACVQQQVPDFVPPEPRSPDDREDNLADADTNGDGSLSLSEVTAATTANAETQFARLDTNGDGFITSTDTAARQEDRAEVMAAMRDCTKAQLGN